MNSVSRSSEGRSEPVYFRIIGVPSETKEKTEKQHLRIQVKGYGERYAFSALSRLKVSEEEKAARQEFYTTLEIEVDHRVFVSVDVLKEDLEQFHLSEEMLAEKGPREISQLIHDHLVESFEQTLIQHLPKTITEKPELMRKTLKDFRKGRLIVRQDPQGEREICKISKKILGRGSFVVVHPVIDRITGKPVEALKRPVDGASYANFDLAIQRGKAIWMRVSPDDTSHVGLARPAMEVIHYLDGKKGAMDEHYEGDLFQGVINGIFKDIPFEFILDGVMELCVGLDALHKAGVVSGDVKLENIFYRIERDDTGKVLGIHFYLADFGDSAIFDLETHEPLKLDGENRLLGDVEGTFTAMTPRVLDYSDIMSRFKVASLEDPEKNHLLNQERDTIALGLDLITLFTGKFHPFPGVEFEIAPEKKAVFAGLVDSEESFYRIKEVLIQAKEERSSPISAFSSLSQERIEDLAHILARMVRKNPIEETERERSSPREIYLRLSRLKRNLSHDSSAGG